MMAILGIYQPYSQELTMMQALIPYLAALHGIAATLWIGGMFFAYMAMRPAAVAVLEPPLRLKLFQAAFSRFFTWVWLFVAVLLITGYSGIFSRFGGFTAPYLSVMHGIGLLMCLIFALLFFALYLPFSKAVSRNDFPKAGALLGKIRWVVLINLLLGLVITFVGIAGSYY